MTPTYTRAVLGLIDDLASSRTRVLCPVAEITGEQHYYVRGTGRVIEWDVLGDPRHTVEVCSACLADMDEEDDE